MAYRQLFLFVEGDDDERFFRRVTVPLFQERYNEVRIVRYAILKKEKLDGFVRSVQSIAGADYLIVRDLDRHPCVTAAKQSLRQRCPQAEPKRIQIVKTEIESWYCAGIPDGDPDWGDLSIARTPDTEPITKENCLTEMATGRPTLLPVLLSLLERFDRKRAAARNGSFQYFLRKHLPEAL
jgi:hypothetical protein